MFIQSFSVETLNATSIIKRFVMLSIMMKFGSSFPQSELKRIIENKIGGAAMKVSASLCYVGGSELKNLSLDPTFVLLSSSLGYSSHPSLPIMSKNKEPQSGCRQRNIKNKTNNNS